MAKCKVFDDVSYCRGQIFKIKEGFGFIKHGSTREDNIFFNLRSIVAPPNTKLYSINRYFSVGEVVECIYSESKGNFSGKLSAIKVWKIENGLKIMDKIIAMNSKVLCGTAKIIHRVKTIGILDVRDDDDEVQNDTELVYFNLREIDLPPEEMDKLSCNNFVHFIAGRASEGSDNDLSWNAIHIWKSNESNMEQNNNQKNLLYAKVEVLSISTVGAVLNHQGNKLALLWTELQLTDSAMEFYELEKGDLMWCLVGLQATTFGNEDDEGQVQLHGAQWIVKKIIDTFTYENEDNHPLPKLYKTNYEAFPVRASKKHLEFEFLKEINQQNEGNNNNVGQVKGRKKAAQNQPEANRNSYPSYSSALGHNAQNNEEANGGCSCSCHYQNGAKGRKKFDLKNCVGTISSNNKYGGKIAHTTEANAIHVFVEFGAHSFYSNGVPIAHTNFPIGTKVHFNALKMDKRYQAAQVWVGSPPENNNQNRSLI